MRDVRLFCLLVLLTGTEPAEPAGQLERLVGEWVGALDSLIKGQPAHGTVSWSCTRAVKGAVLCRRSSVFPVLTHVDLALYGYDRATRRFQLFTASEDVAQAWSGEWKAPDTLEFTREANGTTWTAAMKFRSPNEIDFQSFKTQGGKTTPISKVILVNQQAKNATP